MERGARFISVGEIKMIGVMPGMRRVHNNKLGVI